MIINCKILNGERTIESNRNRNDIGTFFAYDPVYIKKKIFKLRHD